MAVTKNLEILKYCPDYYKIIEHEIMENDMVSTKIIQIFQEYTFSIDINNKEQVDLLKKLTEAVNKYFEDSEFKKEIVNLLSSLRIKVGINNVFEFISKKIVEAYDKYLEFYTRNLYIPRWI